MKPARPGPIIRPCTSPAATSPRPDWGSITLSRAARTRSLSGWTGAVIGSKLANAGRHISAPRGAITSVDGGADVSPGPARGAGPLLKPRTGRPAGREAAPRALQRRRQGLRRGKPVLLPGHRRRRGPARLLVQGRPARLRAHRRARPAGLPRL